MSHRNLKSVNTSDLLNIQGIQASKPAQTYEKVVDTHAPCKKELEKLKRELNAEKASTKKWKALLADSKQSYDQLKRSHDEAFATAMTKHKEQIDHLESQHAKVLISLKKNHDGQIDLLRNKHETDIDAAKLKADEVLCLKLTESCEKYDKIVASKEEQIKNLKSQVAESLKINSMERHKQIDELMKELKHVNDEAEHLRGVIDNYNNQQCQKCSFYENKCKELAKEMATRNENFKALVEVCSKMESQLSQQDELCILLSNLKKVS